VWLHLGTGQSVHIAFWDIARSVLIFLGIPLAAGAITRLIGAHGRGREWYDGVALPRIAPLALLALLYTIVVMFSLKGGVILTLPSDVLRIAVPLLVYVALMFGVSFWWGRRSVVSLLLKLSGDSWRKMLVEEQFHAVRSLLCRRSQVASASAASARFRSIH
jgi:ACR3 family arsenite efflux pump ArsB